MAHVCAINMKGNQMANVFLEKVDSLLLTLPLVTYLRDDALEDRHWEEIFEALQFRLELDDESFTLSSLIDLNVLEHKDKLEQIAQKAN